MRKVVSARLTEAAPGRQGASQSAKIAITVFEHVTAMLGKERGKAIPQQDAILGLLWSGGLAYLGYALNRVSNVLGHASTLKALTTVPWSRIVMAVEPGVPGKGMARLAYSMWGVLKGQAPLPDGDGGQIDPTAFSKDHIFTICSQLCEEAKSVACREVGVADNPYQLAEELVQQIKEDFGPDLVPGKSCSEPGVDFTVTEWLPESMDGAHKLNEFGEWLRSHGFNPGIDLLAENEEGRIAVQHTPFGLMDAFGPIAQSVALMMMGAIREQGMVAKYTPANLRAMMERPQTVWQATQQLLLTGIQGVTEGGPGRVMKGIEYIGLANLIVTPLGKDGPFKGTPLIFGAMTSMLYGYYCLTFHRQWVMNRANAEAKKGHEMDLIRQVSGRTVSEETWAISRVLGNDVDKRRTAADPIGGMMVANSETNHRLHGFLEQMGYAHDHVELLGQEGRDLSAAQSQWVKAVKKALVDWAGSDYISSKLWTRDTEKAVHSTLKAIRELSSGPDLSPDRGGGQPRHRKRNDMRAEGQTLAPKPEVPDLVPYNPKPVQNAVYRDFYALMAIVFFFLLSTLAERLSVQ